jgi:rhomboid family GlyGly-CTERM serine protease
MVAYRLARRAPLISLALAATAILVHALPDLESALSYSRSAVAGGAWWQLATCHWTHWSAEHLAWDVAMFALLGGVCEQTNRGRFACALAGSAVLIPAILCAAAPGLLEYRGLSGLDSSLFVLAAVLSLRRAETSDRGLSRAAMVMILGGFAGKVAWETATGTAIFVSMTDFAPVPLAHAVGGVIGLVCGLWGLPWAMMRTGRSGPVTPQAGRPI